MPQAASTKDPKVTLGLYDSIIVDQDEDVEEGGISLYFLAKGKVYAIAKVYYYADGDDDAFSTDLTEATKSHLASGYAVTTDVVPRKKDDVLYVLYAKESTNLAKTAVIISTLDDQYEDEAEGK